MNYLVEKVNVRKFDVVKIFDCQFNSQCWRWFLCL